MLGVGIFERWVGVEPCRYRCVDEISKSGSSSFFLENKGGGRGGWSTPLPCCLKFRGARGGGGGSTL